MLITYLFRDPKVWVVPLIIQIVSYWRILGKMGKNKGFAIVPILGEMEMSTDLFRNMRSFWRPAAVTAAMFLTSRYLGMDNTYSLIMALVALIVYGIFLIRLYSRLAKQFGKGKFFTFGLIMMPLVFLPILAFGKSAYLGRPQFKPEKERSATANRIINVKCFLITILILPSVILNRIGIGEDFLIGNRPEIILDPEVGSIYQRL